jgi:Holliday junction resolvase RusA-like endonuclease
MTFTILGKPMGKQRPKFARRGNFVNTYTPSETVMYENLVKLTYQQEQGKLHEGEVQMSISAYYAIPKSTSKKKSLEMLNGTIRPTKKPDIDNVIKIIADSLNGIAYHDDTQIVSIHAYKYYAEIPLVRVKILEVQNEQ